MSSLLIGFGNDCTIVKPPFGAVPCILIRLSWSKETSVCFNGLKSSLIPITFAPTSFVPYLFAVNTLYSLGLPEVVPGMNCDGRDSVILLLISLYATSTTMLGSVSTMSPMNLSFLTLTGTMFLLSSPTTISLSRILSSFFNAISAFAMM